MTLSIIDWDALAMIVYLSMLLTAILWIRRPPGEEGEAWSDEDSLLETVEVEDLEDVGAFERYDTLGGVLCDAFSVDMVVARDDVRSARKEKCVCSDSAEYVAKALDLKLNLRVCTARSLQVAKTPTTMDNCSAMTRRQAMF
ncbi:uncharacterized protein SCHCODRAFT_02574288 [Schizophyllum commune H4-8]|nr:uncharacterized protein SCHCODRAFT_02574288 [Schizophyllum commune H4-8]KAI5893140.1 hypothetical protein SCHCODRAFT_02574288 [Schizophyllum commune H4-8]